MADKEVWTCCECGVTADGPAHVVGQVLGWYLRPLYGDLCPKCADEWGYPTRKKVISGR